MFLQCLSNIYPGVPARGAELLRHRGFATRRLGLFEKIRGAFTHRPTVKFKNSNYQGSKLLYIYI